MKKNKLFKFLALMLALALCMSIFAGCTDEGTSSENTESVSEDDDYFIYDPTGTGDSEGDGDKSDSSGKEDSSDKTGSSGKADNSDSSDKSNNTGSSDKGSNSKDRLEVFKNMPSKLKGTTVSFAQWGDEGSERYRKLAQKFTDDYGIKIKWVNYNQGTYASEIATQIAAKNSPDIIICNDDLASVSEIAQPLPSYFDLDDGFWDKRMSEASKIKDKYYFVNSYNSTKLSGQYVFYNKNIFSSKGITSPEDYYKAGKWSFENFEKCMENVDKAGYTGALIDFPLTIARRIGGRDIFTYNPKTATFSADITNSAVVQAVQLTAEWREKGFIVDSGNFTAGQIGMCFGTAWYAQYNGRLKDMAPSDVGVVPLPTSYKGKNLANNHVMAVMGYGIAKGAKNPEGAYYFLRYYLDYQNYQDAGINIFSNKALEKYFMQTILPIHREAKNYAITYINSCTRPTDYMFYPYNDPWKAAFSASSGQVATELAKLQGICNNAAKIATNKIKNAK